METKQLNGFNLLCMGSLFIGLGIFILSTNTLLFSAITYLFGFVFLATGLFKLSQLIFVKINKKERGITITNVMIQFLSSTVLFVFPNMPMSIFAFAFGIYIFALSCTHGLSFFVSRHDKVRGRWKEAVSSLFYLVFALFLGLTPYQHMSIILNVIGGYFILYGFFYIKDMLIEWIPTNKKDKIKRHVRISLPVFLQAILPKFILDEVNHYLTPSEEKEIDARSEFAQYNSEGKADVEIFIHASKKGFGQVGHVDVCIQDEFFSYGNYDNDSHRFNELVGDGVLIVTHKEEYIPFVIKDSEKTLFCFGLKLNESQKQKVLEKLRMIKENTYDWKPPFYIGDDDMYASRLLHACDETAFYKFKKGKFKTYFVVKTNCVQLADYIIGSAGLDILNMNGIVTPGAYYEYLQRQFAMRSEMVMYKKIYN